MGRLAAQYGAGFHVAECDAVDAAGIAHFGRIDSVVSNAANGQDQLLMDTDLETIRRIVDINIVGPTILTCAAIKRMLLQGAGNICSVSSICGSRGYAGIFINCVAPGFFESEMSSVLLPEQLATIKRRTPSGSLSNEENIFKVVDLVISGTTNMQGQVVYVDGGITS